MSGPLSSHGSGQQRSKIVEHWEDLPDGEWLENDEDGTHWYQDVEGNYWHSTDEGYRIWVTEEDNLASTTATEMDADDDGEEEEESEPENQRGPVPRLGPGTAMVEACLAILVIGWTWFITMPTAAQNIELQSTESTQWGGEMSQVFLEGLEFYQSLNLLTIVLCAAIVAIAVMSMVKKTPWWAMFASHFVLFSLLLFASLVAFSAERNAVDACDPTMNYCYGFEVPSLFLVDAFYAALLYAISSLFVLRQSMNAWSRFDPNEEPEPKLDVQLFSADAPKLGALPALVGLFTSLGVLGFTQIIAMGETEEKMDFATDAGLTDRFELYEALMFYHQVVTVFSVVLALVSLLTFLKKVPWYALPSALLLLVTALFATVRKGDFMGIQPVEHDAFLSGAFALLAMMAVSVSAFRTLANHEWEELDDGDLFDDFSTKQQFDFFDEDEEEEEEEEACAFAF
ncbi:MAG: hypothetical protein QF531_05965, partial [Candidatus Poseidonia sp.]|nr:hypothetical protein [Poseidonia sp.]